MLQLPDEIADRQPIVIFDGECNLCNKSVRFLIRHNRSGNLSFTSLQSNIGIKILELAGKSVQKSDTLLLVQNNEIYSYSTAALKTAVHLSFPWNLSGVFLFVPLVVRDAVYSYIAKNRYHWFGRKPGCIIDSRDTNQRFL